jgi:prophage regulatory protein
MSQQDAAQSTVDRFLTRPEVERMTGLRCTTIYKMMGTDDFPRSLRITPKKVVWRESEVVRWMNSIPRNAA